MEKYIKEMFDSIKEETNFCSEFLKEKASKRILTIAIKKIAEFSENEDFRKSNTIFNTRKEFFDDLLNKIENIK